MALVNEFDYWAIGEPFPALATGSSTYEFDYWAEGEPIGGLTPSNVQTYSITLSGTLTPTGALTKEVDLVRSGGVTPTGTLTAGDIHVITLSGTLTPSGVLVRSVAREFDGVLTPSGALAQERDIPLDGILMPTGSLTTLIILDTGGRVTQETVETMVSPSDAHLRVTQDAIEVQVSLGGATNTRTTQETVEAMVSFAVNERVTQMVVETMVSFAPPLPPPGTTVCTTPTRAWINLYDTNGILQAVFDDWKTLDIQHTLNTYSTCTLTIDGLDTRIASFVLDGIVQVMRDVGGTIYQEYVGFHRAMQTELTSDQHSIFTSTSRGLLDLLRRRYIYYQAITAFTLKSDKVDIILQQIVNENAGPGAVSPPRFTNGVTPGLSVPTAPGLGPTWAGKLDNENVLETLQKIVPLTNVDFDVVLDTIAPPTFSFLTYWPQRGFDRSAYLAFDPILGNAIVPVYKLDNSEEINVVAVLGPGQDSSRRVFPVQGTDLTASPWNILEGTENDSSDQTLEGMIAAGQAKLNLNIPKETFTIDALQQDTAMYGRDYAVGDVVTARYGAISRTVKIVGATVGIAQGKESLSLKFAELPV